MTLRDAERQRDDYLRRLDGAMRELPHGVASEIRAGIAEELSGLDADAVTARIAQLGDPETIAREAHDEVPSPQVVVVPGPVAAAPQKPSSTGTRGFATVAALTLSFGGIVLPVAGWFLGAVLVCMSPLWRVWEKTAAIVVPFGVAVILAVGGLAAFSVVGEASEGSTSVVQVAGGDGFAPPAANPLLPAGYDIVWSSMAVAALLLIPASGLWLLWRLRGRASR